MKGKHRKELETNVLADKLGQMLKGGKSAKHIWALLLLVAIGIVAYWWWTSYTAERNSVAWKQYWSRLQTGEVTYLERFIKDFGGTAAAQPAQVNRGHYVFNRSQASLNGSNEELQKSFLQAIQSYQAVSQNPGKSKLLTAQALLSEGKCYEWLAVVSHVEENPDTLKRQAKELGHPWPGKNNEMDLKEFLDLKRKKKFTLDDVQNIDRGIRDGKISLQEWVLYYMMMDRLEKANVSIRRSSRNMKNPCRQVMAPIIPL